MQKTSQKEERGQQFLARLARNHLRTGGKAATDWLIANGDFRADKRVLDIGSHDISHAIQLAKQFDCHVIAVVFDHDALTQAEQAIQIQQISHLVQVQLADATQLPFADAHFDILINSAMLSMQSPETQTLVLNEALRVLKPNGFLLTYDLLLNNEECSELLADLSQILAMPLAPHGREAWKTTFTQAGFRNVELFSGELKLLSPKGLLNREGLFGTMKLVRNALHTEHRDAVKQLLRTLHQLEKKMGFIAVCSQK